MEFIRAIIELIQWIGLAVLGTVLVGELYLIAFNGKSILEVFKKGKRD